MAIITCSLDTTSRHAVLTINGVIVPATDFYAEKYIMDGKDQIRFGYTVENIDSNGLKERRQFYLPSPEELAVDSNGCLNEDGLASKVVYDDQKAIASTIDFLKRNRNQNSA